MYNSQLKVCLLAFDLSMALIWVFFVPKLNNIHFIITELFNSVEIPAICVSVMSTTISGISHLQNHTYNPPLLTTLQDLTQTPIHCYWSISALVHTVTLWFFSGSQTLIDQQQLLQTIIMF